MSNHARWSLPIRSKKIIVSDRRKEVDFYKKFIGDDNFQMAFMHSLLLLVDRESSEKR